MTEEIKYTHRTRDGRKARIIGKLVNNETPIIIAVKNKDNDTEYSGRVGEDLKFHPYSEHAMDLVSEITPYDDWPIDAKVVVWNNSTPNLKINRYFSGVKGGKPTTWSDGATSWSNNEYRNTWDNAELVEEKTFKLNLWCSLN